MERGRLSALALLCLLLPTLCDCLTYVVPRDRELQQQITPCSRTPSAIDSFKEAGVENRGTGKNNYLVVRDQQRNGRKCVTTVGDLCMAFREEFCCKDGTVLDDVELSKVIGDQQAKIHGSWILFRDSICTFE